MSNRTISTRKEKEKALQAWDGMVEMYYNPTINRRKRVQKYMDYLKQWRVHFPLPSNVVDAMLTAMGR